MSTTTNNSLRESATIVTRQAFAASNLRGGQPWAGLSHAGRLPSELAWGFSRGVADFTITYAVYSYGTPIAWYDNERGWIMPSERYSVTTSKHQSIVRDALRGEQVTA